MIDDFIINIVVESTFSGESLEKHIYSIIDIVITVIRDFKTLHILISIKI